MKRDQTRGRHDHNPAKTDDDGRQAERRLCGQGCGGQYCSPHLTAISGLGSIARASILGDSVSISSCLVALCIAETAAFLAFVARVCCTRTRMEKMHRAFTESAAMPDAKVDRA